MKFVSYIKRGKDWAPVDRAFGNLPESTEQIIHPEKYLRDHPKPVQIPADARLHGTSLGQDTAGEFTIRCWARENGSGDEAAAGWGGDRYETFRTSTGLAGVWMTTWDSDKDAVEFENWPRNAVRKCSEAGATLRCCSSDAKMHRPDVLDFFAVAHFHSQIGIVAAARGSRIVEVQLHLSLFVVGDRFRNRMKPRPALPPERPPCAGPVSELGPGPLRCVQARPLHRVSSPSAAIPG